MSGAELLSISNVAKEYFHLLISYQSGVHSKLAIACFGGWQFHPTAFSPKVKSYILEEYRDRVLQSPAFLLSSYVHARS